jgi:hypothetical protein
MPSSHRRPMVHMRALLAATLVMFSVACGEDAAPPEDTGPVDLTGHWIFSDSSYFPNPEILGLTSNICLKWNRPFTITPDLPADSTYYGYETLGGSLRCELNGTWQAETNLDDFSLLGFPMRVTNGHVVFYAPSYTDSVYVGEIVNSRLIVGTRTGYFDGRLGTWKLVR